jgi:hypothetical protein
MSFTRLSVECIARQLCLMLRRQITLNSSLEMGTDAVRFRLLTGNLYIDFIVTESELTQSLGVFTERHLKPTVAILTAHEDAGFESPCP